MLNTEWKMFFRYQKTSKFGHKKSSFLVAFYLVFLFGLSAHISFKAVSRAYPTSAKIIIFGICADVVPFGRWPNYPGFFPCWSKSHKETTVDSFSAFRFWRAEKNAISTAVAFRQNIRWLEFPFFCESSIWSDDLIWLGYSVEISVKFESFYYLYYIYSFNYLLWFSLRDMKKNSILIINLWRVNVSP